MIKNNDRNIRTIALLEAVKLCDNEENLGLIVNVKQPAISKWLSNPSITIKYDLLLKIEKDLGINIERLAPHKPINSYVKERPVSLLQLREIFKSAIITTDSVSLPFLQPDRLIIIGTDAVLISGLAILNEHSEDKINALVLDLTAIITGTSSINDLLHLSLTVCCLSKTNFSEFYSNFKYEQIETSHL